MKKYLVPFLFSMPSVLAGTLVMYHQGISATIYLQNLIFLALGSILSILYMPSKYKLKIKGIFTAAVLCALLLCSPFLFTGIEGVHRWVQIGPVSLNIAYIVLPILLIEINKLAKIGRQKIGYILILAIAAILFLQPDASMISAFSVALLPILYSTYSSKFFRGVVLTTLLCLSMVSWWNVDGLHPVSYVENILVLAKESGWPYLLFSVISLLILICPFVKVDMCPQRRVISISLGLFFLVLILCTLFGNFPVPLIGYGISPVIGYLVSVTYVEKARIDCV